MNIAYVNVYNAQDITKWSGTGYYIGQTLTNKGFNVYYIDNLKEKYSFLFKLKQAGYKYILKKRFIREVNKFILQNYACQILEKLKNISYDLILTTGTGPIGYLDVNKPIILINDSTFPAMVNFYKGYFNLCNETLNDGILMDKLALDKVNLAIYSSQWAIDQVIKNYNVDKKKLALVPFGANIECNRELEDIKQIVKNKDKTTCKLLFIGVDWERKGGEIALNVAYELNRLGLKTELRIIGCKPKLKTIPPFLKIYGFINKNNVQGRELINKLFIDSHFLIVPSRAECYGIVFCEACSFGVPSITTNVGGIPQIIIDNINGKKFELNASISDYCDYILKIFTDTTEYTNMAFNSFNEYKTRLNWNVAGEKLKKLIFDVIRG